MKKILALLLALCALFVLTACDKDEEGAPAGGDTAHTHSYSSEVTTAATCTKNGVKTLTCTCGDSYAEEIVTTGHAWGGWEIVSHALLGKPGEEKRTCSACSESETKERTANAIANSFADGGLAYIALSNGHITGYSLLEYASHELHEHLHHAVPMETIFSSLSERFNITADLRADMIDAIKESSKYSNQFGYDEANNTLTLQYPGEHYGDSSLLGYVHNGDNNYTIYYEFGAYDYITDDFAYVMLKATFEYNKTNGKPNKYLSFEMIDFPPDDMIACPADERSEFIG